MSDKDPIKPIVILEVKPQTGKSGNELKDCFFMPSEIEGFYNFLDKHGRTLATGVSSDSSFPFLLDGHAWTIEMGRMTDVHAHGSWSNSAPAPIGSGPAAEQDGSFQASSSGGAEPDAITESVSATTPTGACVIDGVSGTSDKDKLRECYFVQSGTTWNLYNKHGVLLQSGISSGNDFTFNHDKNPGNNNTISWTVTSFTISTQDSITTASGNWTNNDPSIVDEQSGSFQASSSGGAGEGEMASGASA